MRWIDDRTPHNGALNMAIDEVLLEAGGWQGDAVLRTYGWERPERSIGYFSPLAAQESWLAGGGRVIRRLTGGGAVDHGEGVDFTYSLIFSVSDRHWGLSGAERYREIHHVVAEVLRAAGVDCGLAPAVSQSTAASGVAGCDCYRKPVAWDILAPDGRKLAGGGQRRRRDGLLHQGSIRAGVGGEAFRCALAEGFEAGDRNDLCPSVLAAGRELARKKYATQHWLRGREPLGS